MRRAPVKTQYSWGPGPATTRLQTARSPQKAMTPSISLTIPAQTRSPTLLPLPGLPAATQSTYTTATTTVLQATCSLQAEEAKPFLSTVRMQAITALLTTSLRTPSLPAASPLPLSPTTITAAATSDQSVITVRVTP
jgi:hypothetical protein